MVIKINDPPTEDYAVWWIREGLWPFRPRGDMYVSVEQTMDLVDKDVRLCIEFPEFKDTSLVVYVDHKELDQWGFGRVDNGLGEKLRDGFRYRPIESVPDNVVLGEN